MTPSNSGAPGARCGIAATRSPPTALQTVVSTVEYSDSPLYIFKIYMLILLADNILYAGSMSRPLCPVAVAAVTTESNTIHPGFLRQILPALLERSSFWILGTRSIQR